jgi:hypothetical protein
MEDAAQKAKKEALLKTKIENNISSASWILNQTVYYHLYIKSSSRTEESRNFQELERHYFLGSS